MTSKFPKRSVVRVVSTVFSYSVSQEGFYPTIVYSIPGIFLLRRQELLVCNTHVGPTAEHYIHSIEVGCTNGSSQQDPPIVVLPGYGCGGPLFFQSLSRLGG